MIELIEVIDELKEKGIHLMISNNTILITGGAGFIGSTLANHLIKKENKVVIIDDLSMGNLDNLDNSKKIDINIDTITNETLLRKVFSDYQFDYIFHLGAIASVADSVENPTKTHKVNFESTLLILELIRKYQKNLKRLVFSSSAAVYGDELTLPKSEDHSVIRPLTPYAVDKYSSERYVLNYYSLYGVPTSAVRFFNVYGPKQNPASPYSGVISILLNAYKKFNLDQTVKFNVYGNGEQTRDFVFVEDVISALQLVATSPKSLGEVYNVGTGNSTSLNDIINILDNLLSLKIPVEYLEARKGDIMHSFSTIEKLKQLGFSPKYDIYKGMKKYLEKEF